MEKAGKGCVNMQARHLGERQILGKIPRRQSGETVGPIQFALNQFEPTTLGSLHREQSLDDMSGITPDINHFPLQIYFWR